MKFYRGRKAYLYRTFKFYQLKHDRWNRLFGYGKSRSDMKKNKIINQWFINKIRSYCV
jgi:hypothetical protein